MAAVRLFSLSHSSLYFMYLLFFNASAQALALDVHGIESRASAGMCPSLINHGLAQQAQLHLDTC